MLALRDIFLRLSSNSSFLFLPRVPVPPHKDTVATWEAKQHLAVRQRHGGYRTVLSLS